MNESIAVGRKCEYGVDVARRNGGKESKRVKGKQQVLSRINRGKQQ